MSFDNHLKAYRSVREKYEAMVAAGEIDIDPAQLEMADLYDELIEELGSKRLSRKSSALGWLFGRSKKASNVIKGFYVYGKVGRGKTMLMDMFFKLLPVERKRRAHFNDFMVDVHNRIHAHRQAFKNGTTKQEDPIPPVAQELSEQAWVLCFDEFTVTDIADAMILSRLFTALFERGVVLIATSNVAPDDLYRDGLNRQLFLPFVSLLKQYVRVINLDSRTDYRLEKLNKQPVYLSPLNDITHAKMDEAWDIIKDGQAERQEKVNVKGRIITVPCAVDGAARFSFEDLCVQPLAAADYLAIVKRYQTLMIDNVPVLDLARRNEAKRFILLVDTAYDQHIRLFISAEAEPEKLYIARTGTEAFEFDRTVSRLFEMQSADYLETVKEK